MTAMPREAAEALDGLRAFGGDDLVRALLETFLDFGGKQLATAERAAAAGDAAEVARVAHLLKSSALQVGVPRMSEACASAEEAVKERGDVEAARGCVVAMRREFDVARGWMEAWLRETSVGSD